MTEWQTIESAPKDGRLVLCWRKGWNAEGTQLSWKTNPRIVSAHAEGQLLEMAESYFGDPIEWDDYDLAQTTPTHWLPQPLPPA